MEIGGTLSYQICEGAGRSVVLVEALAGLTAEQTAADLIDGAEGFDPAVFRREGAEWFVTPRSIDTETEVLARLLGWGISAALHVDVSVEEVEKWTS